MADAIDWSLVKHFTRDEWVKDPDRIAPDVVYLLDEMRDEAKVSIVIHVAWDDTGHVKQSSHYSGWSSDVANAVDFHFVGWTLLEQWLFAERFPWSGIGMYPYWNQPGLHCDLRRLGRDHSHLGKRWWRDKDGVYKAPNADFLRLLLEHHDRSKAPKVRRA
jgi:hypothetical protein